MGRIGYKLIEVVCFGLSWGQTCVKMLKYAEHDCISKIVFGDLGAVKRSCCLKNWNAGCETMVVKQKNAEGYLLRLALY